MDIKFNIFISHDASDQAIAIELKGFLESIFLNLTAYVSGRDLESGQTWIEKIKLALKSSQVVIALITKNSINSNWLYFEAGAGFVDDCTIPLIADDLQFKDLTPPLSLLQARMFNRTGVPQLLSDIAKKLSLRTPTHYPGLEELIDRTNNLLNASSKKAIVSKIVVADKYPIPKEDELQKMNLTELCQVAVTFNIPTPFLTNLIVLSASMGLPSPTDDEWKKLNAKNDFDTGNKELDRYESQS